MSAQRLRVLVLSDLFPNPARPAFGIFVERQVFHLQPRCDSMVVAPTRVFPPLRLWKRLLWPKRFLAEWRAWRAELRSIPPESEVNGIRVLYPRYTSPPKQVFHGVWGFFAYLFIRRRLIALHRTWPVDLIHAHYASPSGVIALLAQRWMKIPVVLSIHGSDVADTVKHNPLSTAIMRWVFRGVDAVLANSNWTAEQIVNYGGDTEKVSIVRLGGNTPHYAVTREVKLRAGATTLLSVANLYRSKGHAYALHALRRLINMGYSLEYIVVGDGPERSSLEKLTKELNIEQCVYFEGYKSHSEVWPYLAACDIFVLPSWIEGFGMVYLEALGLGKPVVGCAGTGGAEDLRTFGECIELVKPRNIESLVQALKRLLDAPERRRQMGETGRRIVQHHFSWERNAADTFTIYRRVLDARTRSKAV